MSALNRFTAVVGCALVCGFAALPSAGQATVETTRVRQEMSGVLPSACTGDLTWSLVFHQVGQTRIDGRSGLHFIGRFNVSDFLATDVYGNEFRGNHTGQYSYNINCGEQGCEYPLEMMFLNNMTIAGQGGAPDQKLRVRFRLIINANGTTTTSVDIVEATCSTD